MNKKFRIVNIVVLAILFGQAVHGRISEKATRGMVGSPQTPEMGIPISSADPCDQLQGILNSKTVNSTYLGARGQDFESKSFKAGCSLSFPGSLSAYADLTYSNFANAIMPGVDLSHAMVNRVDFSGAILTDAILNDINAAAMPINMQNAVLTDAKVQRAYLQEANLKNVQAQGAWFMSAKLSGANMAGGDFQKAQFAGANLMQIQAQNAKFNGADFTRAVVSGDISGADFTGATGITNSAFINLYYTQGNPPIGLPESIMKFIGIKTVEADSSTSSFKTSSGVFL